MTIQVCSIPHPTVSGEKYYFKASKTLYTGNNATDTGITPETEENSSITPLLDTGELMRVGLLERINVYCRVGTNGRGTYRVFCSRDKRNSLIDKYNSNQAGTLNGKQVIGASAGTRRAKYRL